MKVEGAYAGIKEKLIPNMRCHLCTRGIEYGSKQNSVMCGLVKVGASIAD